MISIALLLAWVFIPIDEPDDEISEYEELELRKAQLHDLYEVATMFQIFFAFLLAIGYIVCGAIVLRHHVSSVQTQRSQSRAAVLRITILVAVFSGCLFLQGVAWLWFPFEARYLNYLVFNIVGYLIPELIPVFVQLALLLHQNIVMHQTTQKQRQQQQESSRSQVPPSRDLRVGLLKNAAPEPELRPDQLPPLEIQQLRENES